MNVTLTHHLGSNWTIQCVTDEARLEQDMATMKKLVSGLEGQPALEEIQKEASERMLASMEKVVTAFNSSVSGSEPSEKGSR